MTTRTLSLMTMSMMARLMNGEAMAKQKKHRPAKGTKKFHGATFKLVELGKVVRHEPQRKSKKDMTDGRQ
jgi:hypothetical protein